ncbi:MAG: replication factor C small subunit [Magnetococcales bacterium]|nr:replication factor C small subunit [Magnetococcales bacterium]|tara:strand:- start:20135 stop:21211 length:1077 start_codon:yes stop_codon:yes gene_type:complete
MISFDSLFGVKSKKKNNVDTYSKIKKNIPWVDKYRPKKINDIIYQDEVIKMLSQTLKDGNLPHLLFHGPPGTGKTSTILAIAKELYGPNVYYERVKELNASDERGINVVRDKIVKDAKSAIGKKDPNYLCPPYRIIILDEADAMTTEAQSALRKVMEEYSTITRFCFICNYINKIIDPITSRCVKFRFKPLKHSCMKEKLKDIAIKEKIKLSDEALNTIVETSEGDMRKAITFLQNLGYTYTFDKKDITANDVYESANYIKKDISEYIWNVCIKNKSTTSTDILNLTKKIKQYGYPIHNILNTLIKKVIITTDLNDKQKSLISKDFSDTEKKLIDGADEYLQLLNIFSSLKVHSCFLY